MLGSHLSISGSMVNALNEGRTLALNCVQVFTKNQQQWAAKPLDPAMVAEWHTTLTDLKWNTGGPDNRGGIVSHASYLINLASINDDLHRKSIDLMTDEIERCEALAIPYLVHHPGSFVGADLETGLSRIELAYAEVFTRTRGYKTVSCFEGTVGAGSLIGGRLEHLKALRERCAARTGAPERLGFCLDSCHLHAAGYDLSSAASARAVLDEFHTLCGDNTLKVWHLNDSKGALASKLDRHEHIGQGFVGGGAIKHSHNGAFSTDSLRASGFFTIMNDPRYANTPKILETPKGATPDGTQWDTINITRLKSLLPGMPAAPETAIESTPSKPAPKPSAKPSEKPAAKSSSKPAKTKPASTKSASAKAKSSTSKPKPKPARTKRQSR